MQARKLRKITYATILHLCLLFYFLPCSSSLHWKKYNSLFCSRNESTCTFYVGQRSYRKGLLAS